MLPLPRALVPGGPYDTSAQRDALARLASSVLAGDGRYRALRDILARSPPRIRGREPRREHPDHRHRRAARVDAGARFQLSLHPGAAGHGQDVDRCAAHNRADAARPAGRRHRDQPQGDPQPARRGGKGGGGGGTRVPRSEEDGRERRVPLRQRLPSAARTRSTTSPAPAPNRCYSPAPRGCSRTRRSTAPSTRS